jgi:hypothetical protein
LRALRIANSVYVSNFPPFLKNGMTNTATADDFDVAKKVFDELRELPTERQERVLRWVAETLGIKSLAPGAIAPPPAVQTTVGPPGLGTIPLSPSTAPSASRDIRTFVAEKAPASENQFAAVVAYYYRFESPPEQRRNTIGAADLQEAARLAGRKRLSNPRQTLKNAKALGYLDNPARGEFSINTVGENLVAMTLPGGVDTAARRGPKRGAAARKTSASKKKTRRA